MDWSHARYVRSLQLPQKQICPHFFSFIRPIISILITFPQRRPHGQATQLQTRKKAPRRSAKEKEGTGAAAKGRPQEFAHHSSVNGAPELACDRTPDTDTEKPILAATKMWLERAVIGLGLCPFAANVFLREQIRYRVSTQDSTTGLIKDLSCELQLLRDADPKRCETTLLIHPHVLSNFFDYNEFLNEADEAVFDLGLTGELQIASFHPAYQFAGCAPDDIENYSNRSPYPMLHLLREASVTRAVATFPDINEIGSNNISTLRRLGKAGWQRLELGDSLLISPLQQ